MDTIEAMHGRRSIRSYRPDPVDRGVLEELLWAAAQAPTPPISGAVPWAFHVIEGIERLAELGRRAKQYAHDHQPPGQHWAWTERPEFKVFWDAPAVVLICGRRDNPEAAFDCARAGQNLMLAAHARGIGTCWVGAPMPWLSSPGVAAELDVPAGFDPVVAMLLGQPREMPAGSPRPRPAVTYASPPPLARGAESISTKPTARGGAFT